MLTVADAHLAVLFALTPNKMSQVQCPNCKMFKTVYKGTHGAGNGVAAGSCLIWIFPPLGILIILADLIVSFFRVTTSDNTRLCLNCKFVFKPEVSEKEKAALAKAKAVSSQRVEKRNILVMSILAWFFGIMLTLVGFSALVSGEAITALAGLMWLFCGLWTLPPLAEKMNAKVKVPTLVKILIVLALVFVAGAIMPNSTTAADQEVTVRN